MKKKPTARMLGHVMNGYEVRAIWCKIYWVVEIIRNEEMKRIYGPSETVQKVLARG